MSLITFSLEGIVFIGIAIRGEVPVVAISGGFRGPGQEPGGRPGGRLGGPGEL